MQLIVRMQGWDSPPDSPMTFCDCRKLGAGHWKDHMELWSSDSLGHQAKIIGGVKTIDRLMQTAYQIHPDGTLTYLGRLDTQLPPPRKVKVINNPTKPIANWLSVLEAPVAVPEEEDEPDEEAEF